MASRGSTFASTTSFGLLLRQLRKRAGMTQRDLAAALGYSDSLISGLEKGQRQPDLAMVHTHFIPALGLQDDAVMATRLIESAAGARGEQRPAPLPVVISPAPRTPAARSANPHRLPALPVELIGRTALINQLSNRLLGHGGRLLTLVGRQEWEKRRWPWQWRHTCTITVAMAHALCHWPRFAIPIRWPRPLWHPWHLVILVQSHLRRNWSNCYATARYS